jgi:hypothetical protein
MPTKKQLNKMLDEAIDLLHVYVGCPPPGDKHCSTSCPHCWREHLLEKARGSRDMALE